MKKMSMSLLLITIIATFCVFLTGCGGKGSGKREITVVSREESSGTRGAFDELMNITDGSTNRLFREAIIVSSTDEAAFKVEVDKFAISYTSFGSVTNKVKALSINGIVPSESSIKSGDYKLFRPFILVKKTDTDLPIADDFIKFATSSQGQAIASKSGYISVYETGTYESAGGLNGKLTISGSTSVEKVIEGLKEAYEALNPGVKVEINYNGSSAGIRDCINGRSDLAVSSRELKANELDQLKSTAFALDGVVVVVNESNAITNIAAETVTKIFKGEIRHWNDI